MSCYIVTLWLVSGSKVGGRDIKKGQVPIAGVVVGKVGGVTEAATEAKRSRGGMTKVIQKYVHYSAYIAHRLLEVRSEAIQLSIPVGE